jgi:hypothetical protein
MFFGSNQTKIVPQDRSGARHAMLTEVIQLCEVCFPSVSIRLIEGARAVNAQASRINGLRLVDLFGGLAFHPTVGRDALAFTLLHEIGHHRGRGPRIAPHSDLACDCAADRWAILEGAPKLARRNFSLNISVALTQLQRATAHLSVALDAPIPNCWCLDWDRRKKVLTGRKIVAPTSTCAFADKFLNG